MDGIKWKHFSHGRYSISTNGEIISVKTGRALVYTKTPGGHNIALLMRGKKRVKVRVDRLILFLFKGIDINSAYPIKHVNGDNGDDFLDNLLAEIPEKPPSPPTHEKLRKLTEDDIKNIVVRLLQGHSSRMISKDFPCGPSVIRNINLGISWKSYTWAIVDSYPIRKKVKVTDRQGEKSCRAKLNEIQVKEIKRLLRCKIPICRISKRFKVKDSTISKIKSGANWSHVE